MHPEPSKLNSETSPAPTPLKTQSSSSQPPSISEIQVSRAPPAGGRGCRRGCFCRTAELRWRPRDTADVLCPPSLPPPFRMPLVGTVSARLGASTVVTLIGLLSSAARGRDEELIGRGLDSCLHPAQIHPRSLFRHLLQTPSNSLPFQPEVAIPLTKHGGKLSSQSSIDSP